MKFYLESNIEQTTVCDDYENVYSYKLLAICSDIAEL